MTLLKLFQPRFAPVSRTATTDEKHVDSPEKDSGTTSAAETNEPELAAISVDALRLVRACRNPFNVCIARAIADTAFRFADGALRPHECRHARRRLGDNPRPRYGHADFQDGGCCCDPADLRVGADTTHLCILQFGNLNQIAVQPAIAIVPQESYPTSIVSHSEGTEMIILPWTVGSSSLPADDEGGAMPSVTTAAPSPNLAEVLFAADSAAHPYTKNFVRRVFAESPRDVRSSSDPLPAIAGLTSLSYIQVGLFIHRGINLMEPLAHQNGVHVFVPFRGGADDRLALSLAAQACLNPRVTATVVRVLPAGAGSSSGQGGPLSTVLTSSTADPADVKLHAAALMESQQTVGRSVRRGIDEWRRPVLIIYFLSCRRTLPSPTFRARLLPTMMTRKLGLSSPPARRTIAGSASGLFWQPRQRRRPAARSEPSFARRPKSLGRPRVVTRASCFLLVAGDQARPRSVTRLRLRLSWPPTASRPVPAPRCG